MNLSFGVFLDPKFSRSLNLTPFPTHHFLVGQVLMVLYTCWYCSIASSWGRVNSWVFVTPFPVIVSAGVSARAAAGTVRPRNPTSRNKLKTVIKNTENFFIDYTPLHKNNYV